MNDMNDMDINETDIAVIGMAGRFPGAPNLEAFWANLRDGVESIKFFTDEELLATGVSVEQLRDPNYVKAKGVLDNVADFDASFFGFSPREAEILDVQHRLFLECAWQALEQAGYIDSSDQTSIGIYAGVGLSSYLLQNIYPHLQTAGGSPTTGGSQTADLYQIMLGNDKDYLPTRVAYKLNLQGPALAVQTACSTSLVAIHLACQSLLSGECDMTMAGGVTVSLPQESGYLYQEGMILSPDGHCRAFDAKAGGTVSGNGAGVVVLKRLEDALEDGDFVWAVIKGTAVNNDGAHKIGYTAPSEQGQAAVIREALALAGLDPADISYVEAHGTGTVLGDPIELAALSNVFGRSAEKWCAIGSVKTNVGHLDTAAGVAGFIKTVLALHHRQLPPSLHFQQPNPEIDFEHNPFYVNVELKDWLVNDNGLRCAGVSSFGIGGTNAHVVLAEVELQAVQRENRDRPEILIVSAKTESGLEKSVKNLARHLQQNPEQRLSDVAFTLANGRQAFDHRCFVVADSAADGATRLLASPSSLAPSSSSTIAFLLPGQGAQYAEMGAGLYKTYPLFREIADRCDAILRPLLGEWRTLEGERAADTRTAQAAIFVIEYALAKLWQSWGIRPAVLLGHSLGELTAACLAGVFSLEDGLRLVARRGELMQSMPFGKMVSVNLSEAEIRPILANNPAVALAAVNGVEQCVISGPGEAINRLTQQLTAVGVAYVGLETSHAFHSAMMEPIVPEFISAVRNMTLSAPQIPIVSNVTGKLMTAEEATDPKYWGRHLRQTVLFSAGLETLLAQSPLTLLEVGPGRALTRLAQRHPARQDSHALITSLPKEQEAESDEKSLLEALGSLWQNRSKVDWKAVYADQKHGRVPLPTYPFNRQKYWIEPVNANAPLPAFPLRVRAPAKDLTKDPTEAPTYYLPSWERSLWPIENRSKPAGLCLIFADALGAGDALAKKAQASGQRAIVVRQGEEFVRLSEDEFSLNRSQSADYELLLARLPIEPLTILHCWTIAPETGSDVAIDQTGVAEMQQAGFFSLLYLVQTLDPAIKTNLVVISNQLHDVTDSDSVDPGKSTVLGLMHVIPQEYAGIECRTIDVWGIGGVPKQSKRKAAEQRAIRIERLWADISSQSHDLVVAHRGRHRWLPSYVPIAPDVNSKSHLTPDGVYLITGGLGGIGYLLAEYLAVTIPGVRLALLGRTSPEDQGSKLDHLQTLGARAMVLKADVSRMGQLQNAFDVIDSEWGAIDGIIHAAGTAGGGLIQMKQPADVAAEFAAPIIGTLNLAALVQKLDKPLDFFVLCSSHTAIVGGVGQMGYSGANAFQDAFAHAWPNVISINWDRWQAVGMAVAIEKMLETIQRPMLTPGLTPEQGKIAFGRIFAMRNSPQVIVATADFPMLVQKTRGYQLGQLGQLDEPKPADFQAHYARPELDQPYSPARTDLEKEMSEVWQSVLGLEQVGIFDDFFSLGGDSLIALKLVAHLQKRLNANLKISTIYDQPTVAALAEHVETIRWLAEGQASSSTTEAITTETIDGAEDGDLEFEEGAL